VAAGDTAKRERNPMEGVSSLARGKGRRQVDRTLEAARSSREDETARESERRTVCGQAIVPVGNDEGVMVPGEPMSQRPDTHNTLESSEPHERHPARR
jgi:hypothetical protein